MGDGSAATMMDATDFRDLALDLVARRRLSRCDRVGPGARAFGAPSVANDGRIEIGSGVVISSTPLRTHFATTPGSLLTIGHGVRVAHGVGIYTSNEVVIDDDTTIGALALILDVDLPSSRRRSTGGLRGIRIGRDVHIGSGVVIVRGASLGHGSRVAPNSLVDRPHPAGARLAGVPARLVEGPLPAASDDAG